MKKVSIVVLVLIGVLAINWNSVKADDEASFEEDRSKALDFLRRSIFHPTKTKCEEQKREAKEDYEERCEPSNPIYRNKGTQRNCPDLNAWEAFKNYEINDGLPTLDDLKPNIKLPKLPKLPTADEVKDRVYNKVTGLKRRAILFHPGATKCEEQKREAREDYEERCEPSFPLHRNTGTNRFCPDINDWKEFDLYEIGNGYSSHDSNSATSYVDRNQNTNNRNGDTRNRPPPIVPNRNDDYED
ncbi:unnamed protein product [Adineta steineri]|uniref:Uncharacterized protein n=1 Tax=Adineta steineri TaxID=433720 RepID=A0A814JM63_9BILA|nr:unnamed protein product [Adineta steineri]CAF1037700.1 unnamed protein product [Adineta steineri]